MGGHGGQQMGWGKMLGDMGCVKNQDGPWVWGHLEVGDTGDTRMVFATTRRPSSGLWFPVHILPQVPWVHTEGPQISQPAWQQPLALWSRWRLPWGRVFKAEVVSQQGPWAQ